MEAARSVEQRYADVMDALPRARHGDPDVIDARWMLEELRVSFFAQVLGTARPVSAQRVRRALAALSA
jgi:ATP-dependent helicase HrpA